MVINRLCTETLQGTPYTFMIQDCYTPISDSKAILLTKEGSPILRNTIVRRMNSKFKIYEFDTVTDRQCNIIGTVIAQDGELKLMRTTGEVEDLSLDYLYFWEPFDKEKTQIYEGYNSPMIELPNGVKIAQKDIRYGHDGNVVIRNARSYFNLSIEDIGRCRYV